MSFSDDIKKFSKKAEKNINLVYRRSCFVLSRSIILDTPVGNKKYWKRPYAPPGYVGGRLRANWQAGIESKPSGTISSEDKGGSLTANKVQGKVSNLKSGQRFYLMNNLPYAHAIEFGHSLRTPNGMMRLNIKRWKNIVKLVASTI